MATKTKKRKKRVTRKIRRVTPKKTLTEKDGEEYWHQLNSVGCKIPYIVKYLLQLEARREGKLLSEVLRQLICEKVHWDDEAYRNRLMEKIKGGFNA